ncbi:MAG: TonB-dependent receptor plug domain-containing protein [Bacteroidota bacterium]
MKKGALRYFPIFLAMALGLGEPVFAQTQQDSIKHRELETLVVTATRQERSLAALPMPVTVVPASMIRTMGSVRLQDALTEQTGLVVVPQINAQGNGLQLQGFNPDYTLILVDGEPLIGRYTGSLELNRITVGNIRQIEIVKGPSSSLYGSEALAGVVNIITDRPTKNTVDVSLRHGTNNTTDITGQGSLRKNNIGLYLFGNRYSTSGYDLSPQNFGKTVSPFASHTLQSKFQWNAGPRTEINVSARLFNETQRFNFEVLNAGTATKTTGTGTTHDWNLNPVIHHRFSDKLKVTTRFYLTRFRTETGLYLESGGTLFYSDNFHQQFARPEAVLTWYAGKNSVVTAGAGYIHETVQTSRYGDAVQRVQNTTYAFAQHEWNPTAALTVIAGARLDRNDVFGSQASPKLSASFRLSEKISIKASSGIGFKAPDFRQLYFNFNNSAGGGYAVLGTEVVKSKVAELEAAGQIGNYFFDPAQLGTLQAERSHAFNSGVDIRFSPTLSGSVNLFRNTVNNLIETQALASTTTGQNLYTYRNINRAVTEGAETSMNWKMNARLQASAGYQLLFALDRDVVENIKAGNGYWRDPETLITRRLRTWEYHGLYNRNRHTANVKLFYRTPSRYEGSLRLIGRSRFGIGDIRGNIQGETVPPSDINSNGILDLHDRFVRGYVLVNLSAARELKNGMRIQAGIDNLLNHREPVFIPNLPGRLAYITLSWKLNINNETINP